MFSRGHAWRDRSLVRALRWLAMVVVLTLAATPAPAASLRSADGIVLVASAVAAEVAPIRSARSVRGVRWPARPPVSRRPIGFRRPNDGWPAVVRGRIYLLDCAFLR
ncbi:hypothetical protein LVJ94_01935 [Pendulispora rubella]|uniref:Uncharacterized protein n=1 Tax=Pendulispora rubella TaxID=2741070 RepID=A0ABZ2L500_9BACT